MQTPTHHEPPAAYTFFCAPMTLDDLPTVEALEVQAFPAPRSAAFYRQELTQNRYANYHGLHAVPTQSRSGGSVVVAYGGYWLLGEDAHVVSIAVAPQWRRAGLAEWLMLELIETAWKQGALRVTLEMRIRNHAAAALYHKLGFQEVGRRKRYYRDNDEDALLLTLEGLQDAQTQQHLATQLARLRAHFNPS
jgi:[ribosomal protein S18]-alanine N-acetyltransferase